MNVFPCEFCSRMPGTCPCIVEPLEVSRARRAVNLRHREARAAFRVSAKRWGRPAA